ncbi:MAG TPA: YraN family protein [Candidatus Sulfotelmatobacter sp.]|nr:YraN family protein [Candidatus Sulfotelmatobacter sp.]
MTAATRRAALRRGRWAERLAACWLIAKGYRIVARNQRTPFGEIDLIARRGGMVALVEVKARVSRADALDALRPMQQQRIARAGAWFVARRPQLQGLDVRCDLVIVPAWRRPVHLPDAWRRLDDLGR